MTIAFSGDGGISAIVFRMTTSLRVEHVVSCEGALDDDVITDDALSDDRTHTMIQLTTQLSYAPKRSCSTTRFCRPTAHLTWT